MSQNLSSAAVVIGALRVKLVILILVIFVGHQLPISAKLYSILTTGFREDNLILLYTYIRKISNAPWQLLFLTNQICFRCFCRKSPNYHFCQTIF